MAAMCKASWYFHMLDWKSRVLLSCFTPAQKAKRDFVFVWKQLPIVTKSWLFTWPAALSCLCIKYSGTQPTQCYWQLLPTIETKMLNFSRVMAMSMMGGAYATHHSPRCFLRQMSQLWLRGILVAFTLVAQLPNTLPQHIWLPTDVLSMDYILK